MIALIGSVTAIQMRSVRHEYALLVGGATAVLLLIEGIVQFSGLSNAISVICDEYGIHADMLTAVVTPIKVVFSSGFHAKFIFE